MTAERTEPAPRLLQSIPIVIAAGCLIAAIGFGPRSTMGFFLTPITNQYGWGREVFALAIAIQNLIWGSDSASSACWRIATARRGSCRAARWSMPWAWR